MAGAESDRSEADFDSGSDEVDAPEDQCMQEMFEEASSEQEVLWGRELNEYTFQSDPILKISNEFFNLITSIWI